MDIRNQNRLDAYRAKLAARDLAAYVRLRLSRRGDLVWLDGKELPIFLRKQAE